MQIEFNFDEDDDTRNALLSPSSGPPLAGPFVPIGAYTEAIVMRLQGGLPSIRCGRSKGGNSNRPRD